MNFFKGIFEKIRTYDRILIFLLFIGVLLRFYGLGRTLGTTGVGSLDEGLGLRTYFYVPFDFIVTNYYVPTTPPATPGNPIFFSILVHLMTVLFGEENEIAIRMPAFLPGIVSLWLIYRIALQLSNSLLVARITLFFTIFCPTHIAYSQTTNSYSLIIFFSAAMIYSSIKFLETKNYLKWGSILALSGILLTYTSPANVFFILGLAFWMAVVLLLPIFRKEYGLDWTEAKPKMALLMVVFLIMGLLTLAAYWPVLDQVQQASKAHALQFNNIYGDHPIYLDTLIIMEKCLLLIFSGAWKWLIPILALGIFFGPVKGLAVRILPVTIFLPPFILSLFTNVIGYPRVYLYNLPLFMLFFGAGTLWVCQIVADKLPRFLKENQALYGFGFVFVLPQAFYLATDYYPSLKTFDGKVYQQRLESETESHDLILVSDVVHYLYTRPVFKDRLMKIIIDNRVSGIKTIAANLPTLKSLMLNDGGKGYPIFNNLKETVLPSHKDLVKGRKLFTIPTLGSKSIAKEDFEILGEWNLVFGKGRWSANNENRFEGKMSLALTPSSDQDMALRSYLPEIHIDKKSYLLLCWAAHRPNGNNWDGSISAPDLWFTLPENPKLNWQTKMGLVNQGMMLDVSGSANSNEVNWNIGARIGILPAGNYNLSILLKAFAGQPILYDGLSLFLIEVG